MKSVYVELKDRTDLIPALKNSLSALKDFKKIGLVTTIQHVHGLKSAQLLLEENGFKVFLAKSAKKDGQGIKSKYEGQVLGCDVSAAKLLENKIDAFLYIGSGNFHPLGVVLETSKPVFALNPSTKQIIQVSEAEIKRYLARKAARLSKLKEAKTIGILVSTKPGQYKPELAEKIKESLEKQGKKAEIFLADNVTANEMLNFSEVELWINTACPRLVDDNFPKTMINADELPF